jgi:hypothetical protein
MLYRTNLLAIVGTGPGARFSNDKGILACLSFRLTQADEATCVLFEWYKHKLLQINAS